MTIYFHFDLGVYISCMGREKFLQKMTDYFLYV